MTKEFKDWSWSETLEWCNWYDWFEYEYEQVHGKDYCMNAFSEALDKDYENYLNSKKNGEIIPDRGEPPFR